MTSPEKPLAGKHALVTGGGRGIGFAVARRLAEHGARVTILGRSTRALKSAVRELQPAEAASVVADVTDADAVRRAVRAAVRKFGHVAILVNNAGQAESSSFLKMDSGLWRRMIAVNLDGVFHCTQAALPGMQESGWGRVVNIASTAALTGYPYVSAYRAAKHGVLGLTRALAKEFARHPITVNAVCPGYTETEMLERSLDNIVARTGRDRDTARRELAAWNPQHRFISPEEVAHAVAWLCLPGSESVTGQAIAVAGGEIM